MFEFRQLCSEDLFPMFGLLNKIGFREFFKTSFQNIDLNEENLTSIGKTVMFELAGTVLSNIEKCKHEIFSILASVSGKSEDEISKLPLPDFAEMVIEFVKKPEFMDFI